MLFLNKLEKKTWEEVHCGPIKGWQCGPLVKYPNLKHLFTGKSNDFNLAKHQLTIFPEKSVDKNREMLCKNLELNYSALTVLPIVHSDNVLVLENEGQKIVESDAIITQLTNIPILITYADCVPILLYVPDKKVLGLVHAGWKGTANRIAEKAIVAIMENYLARPSQIIAAIGPAIGQKKYEVGQDVADLLVNATESNAIVDTIGIKPRIDLKLANYLQLEQTGVNKIYVSEMDTGVHLSQLYSHRVQGKRAGRQGLIACLT